MAVTRIYARYHTSFGRPATFGLSNWLITRRDRLLLISPNSLVHFITMHGYFLGRFHAQPDFVTADFHNDDCNIIVDNNAFVLFP